MHFTTYYLFTNCTLQNDNEESKIMFLATQNDQAKIMPQKAKKKTKLQQCISLHITLPQNIPLQNDTQALKIMFPAAEK